MSPQALFALQFVWFLLAWSAVAVLLVQPRLRGGDVNDELSVWVAPHLFRVLGLGLLVPALAPGMPPGFALPTALGDAATALLALVALVALQRRHPRARALVWVFNLFGSADLLVAGVQAVRFGAAAHLEAQWYVPALGVPLMIVTHVQVFRVLLRESERWARFSGRGVYPHELAFALLLPGRGLILSPRKLLSRLELSPGDRVLEVGPGPGYFSPAVARAIPAGRLQLLDLQHEMLRKARRRLGRAGVANVDFVQASAAALPCAAASFDAAFLVAVLGEVAEPIACMSGLARVLRPGGRLLVAELPGDPDALSEADIRALAEASGLRPLETRSIPGGFTMTLRPSP